MGGEQKNGVVLMDIIERKCSHLMADALRSLSGRQLAIAYLQIEKRMNLLEIASKLHLPLDVVETEDFRARRHVISYLRARGVSLEDVPTQSSMKLDAH